MLTSPHTGCFIHYFYILNLFLLSCPTVTRGLESKFAFESYNRGYLKLNWLDRPQWSPL